MPGFTDGTPPVMDYAPWWDRSNIAVDQPDQGQDWQRRETGERVIWSGYQETICGRSVDIPVDSRLAEDHPTRNDLKEAGVLGEPVVAIGIGEEDFVVVDVSDTPTEYDGKYRAPFTDLRRLKQPGSPPLIHERNDGEPMLVLLHFEQGGIIAVRRLEQGKDREAVFDRTPEAQERMKLGGANFSYRKDSGVSRYQGGVTLSGDTITISDLRSTNGTLIETMIPSQKQEGRESSGNVAEIISYANTMGAKVLELSRKEKIDPSEEAFLLALTSGVSRNIRYLLGERGARLPEGSFDPDSDLNLSRFVTDAHVVLENILGRGSNVDREYRRRFTDEQRTPDKDDVAWLTGYMSEGVNLHGDDNKNDRLHLRMRVEDYTMAAMTLLANLSRENSSRVHVDNYMAGNLWWAAQHYEKIWGKPELDSAN